MPRKRLPPNAPRRSPAGRPQHTDPPVIWEISLPRSLTQKIEILLTDPLTGKTRYGARSRLIESLLLSYLNTLASHSPSHHPIQVPEESG